MMPFSEDERPRAVNQLTTPSAKASGGLHKDDKGGTANAAATTLNIHSSTGAYQKHQNNNIMESSNKEQTTNTQVTRTSAASPNSATAAAKIKSYNNSTIDNLNKFSTTTKRSDTSTVYQRICDTIRVGSRVMVLMRGPSGSGKSTLADKLISESMDLDNATAATTTTKHKICDFKLSTDDYWIDGNGNYIFESAKLPEAHEWNQRRARDKALAGCSPIVIDNTNIQRWQMLPYVDIAVQSGYIIELLEPNTSWRYSVSELLKRNKHNVPREHIENMLDRYEKATVHDLLKLIKVGSHNVKLPQRRLWPPIKQVAQHQAEAEMRKAFKGMALEKHAPMKSQKTTRSFDKNSESLK